MSVWIKLAKAGAISCLAMVAVGTSAQQETRAPVPADRQGQIDASRSHTPNGGRPEIRTADDMKRLAGYTAPGAQAYASLAAEASAGMWPVTLYYRCKNTPGGTAIHAKAPQPIEVFDGVYSIGDDANNIWAIDTADGIILIDTLSSEADARGTIIANMVRMGLDPKRIRYILITHNHLDHFGGAAYLKSLSNARIGMAQADWEAQVTRGNLPLKGPNDFFLTDGQIITLGDRSVTVVLTPGHTPGTASLLFPVTDKGKPYMASLFGGQGSPNDLQSLMTFRQSLNHFADYTDRMQADVVLSNHTVGDDGLSRVAKLALRRDGEPNPYVVGREGVVRYDALWRACLSADIDQITRTTK
ncbi:metallo-beta-lactamase superfamily protein [Novosphingobium kunmingense]|uniref:Metallo-beta-lactamase superfamily protein n=1 Tax=Novosphingobium kunmingense TaxID=1211806 RepID=A0A2N0H343_9SPHN|nr:MBL fold metallo-hydrolase [Novosphingobium kunmingense]PKB13366.1 metallo-beta-lactamase superfamily protein [Novosphingobium kunmingense]